MKTIATLTTAAILFLSCGQKRVGESDIATDPQEWPQLDAFHMVMAESFHPYADSGNLEPARKHAAEMASLSAAWAQEALPEKVDNETTRRLLNELGEETAAFSAMTATAPDDSLAAALTSIHDLFHKIQETWHHPTEEEQEQ